MIPLSFSFLNDFANCPHKAYRRYVKKDLPRPPETPEQREGNTTHRLIMMYLRGHPNRLPVSLEPFVLPFKARKAEAEVWLAMTEDMRPANEDEPVWLKGKIDVLIVEPPNAFIVDWKTGKVREDPKELLTYALLLRANFPEVNKISGCYVWLKEGRMGAVYDLTDVNRTYHAIKAAARQAEGYQLLGDWPAEPNALCAWCPVADCRFNCNPSLDGLDKVVDPAILASSG